MLRALAAGGAALYVFCLLWMGPLESGGPAHMDLVMPGGVPATLYVPLVAERPGRLPPPPPRRERPPGLVLVHGFSADRAGMSSLARRLAGAGYAVLAPDLRGHGANSEPFAQGPHRNLLAADVATAVDWLRASAYVDGSHIAVAGHSMGAASVMRFAQLDTGIDATVMISGSSDLFGPHRPPNSLFLWAAADPGGLKQRAARVAAELAGAPGVELGLVQGDFARQDAVRTVEIPGVDHTFILWSEAAAGEILDWLDAAFHIDRDARPPLRDPRVRPLLLGAIALPFVLLGIGLVLGALAPRWPEEDGSALDLVGLAVALAITLPVAGLVPLASFLGLDVADSVVGHLALTGVVILAVLALRERPFWLEPRGPGRSLAVAAAGFAAAFAVLAPLGPFVHRLVLTPPRAWSFALTSLALLPFFVAFESLVRRGPPGVACLRALLGRVLVIAALLIGVAAGVLPFVIVLLLGPLVAVFVFAEIVAAATYAGSRNRLAIALFESALLAGLLAAMMPLR